MATCFDGQTLAHDHRVEMDEGGEVWMIRVGCMAENAQPAAEKKLSDGASSELLDVLQR